MLGNKAVRRGVATLALVAMLLPGPVLAQSAAPPASGGSQSDSITGALMAVACGGSIKIGAITGIPVVWAVAGFTCALMFLDAFASRD